LSPGVVLERLWFLLTAGRRSSSGAVEKVFGAVERGDLDGAAREGQRSSDRLARILAFGLEHRHISLSNSLIQAKLTPKSKAVAKRQAKKAGRKYPNLVDNMNAAKKQRTRRAKTK
jgi:hypothetical protein